MSKTPEQLWQKVRRSIEADGLHEFTDMSARRQEFAEGLPETIAEVVRRVGNSPRVVEIAQAAFVKAFKKRVREAIASETGCAPVRSAKRARVLN